MGAGDVGVDTEGPERALEGLLHLVLIGVVGVGGRRLAEQVERGQPIGPVGRSGPATAL